MALEFKCNECGKTEPVPDELTMGLALRYRKRYICSACIQARQDLREERRRQLEEAWAEKEEERKRFRDLADKIDREKFIREGMNEHE